MEVKMKNGKIAALVSKIKMMLEELEQMDAGPDMLDKEEYELPDKKSDMAYEEDEEQEVMPANDKKAALVAMMKKKFRTE
jgi:hypothetical protein